jgi:uncharacterized protein with ParB-like and HNH nuclease domain
MDAVWPMPPRSAIDGTLKLTPVMKIKGKFTVRGYQRGYRWGKDEVRQLIDDIVDKAVIEGRNYCLQPVVVKRQDDAWELIDGQQRLS